MKRKKNVDVQKKSKKTKCDCDDMNWPNLNETFSEANTFLGIGSPELATVGVSDKFFNMNAYLTICPTANFSDFSLGQSSVEIGLHSNGKYRASLAGALSVGNTYMGVGLAELPTVSTLDRYSHKSIYSDGNPTGYLSDFSLGQSVVKASLHSDGKYRTSLAGALSIGNTYMGVGLAELPTDSIFDRYSHKSIYSDGNPTGYLSDFSLGQSVVKASLHSDGKYRTSLAGALSVGNTYMGVGLAELPTVSTLDRYSHKSIYSDGNPTGYLSDFSLGQSVVKASLHSDGKYRTSLAGALSVGNTYMGVGLAELPTVSTLDRYSHKSIYSDGNPTGYLSDFSLGQSVVKASLHSDGKYRTSLAGALSVGSDLKFVENSNIEHVNWQLGKNGYLTNPISAFKEYDVFNIGNDFLKRENKDLERCIKQECQKIAEMVKIDPNHIGLEACGTSQKPTFNIYFVFTGSITSNNLQIGDKNITIVNYGK